MKVSVYLKIFLTLVLGSFVLLPSNGSVGGDAAYFRCYYDKLNLPQTSILQITQDGCGYLWLATGRGVYRFDGNEVVALSEILPDYQKELNGYISWIFIDGQENLWLSNGCVCELNSGIVLMNTMMDAPALNAPLLDAQGNMWFNYRDRFEKRDGTQGTAVCVPASVALGFTQSDHYVWGMSVEGYLYRMSIGVGDIATLKYDLSKWVAGEVSVLKAISDESILIGTKSSGLWRYDTRTQTAHLVFREDYVRDILGYSPSVYWIATENGIYIYDVGAGDVGHWRKDPHDVFAIRDHAIYSFYKDREGGVWCGSYFRGLSYVPNSQCQFRSFKPSKKYPGLEGTVMREFCKDGAGNLWIATEDNGLNCYNISENSFVNYSKGSGLKTNNVYGLCLDGNELWCGSFDSGIEIFDVNSRRVVCEFREDDGYSNLKSDSVLAILKARDGNVWVGTDCGIQCFNKAKNYFEDIYEDIADCSQLYQGKDACIWCVCLSDLYCVSADGVLEKYSFPNGTIQSVLETRDNEVWVATSSGIARLDKSKRTFVRYQLSDQNSSTNYAYRILEDGQGFFWISTAHGLVRFQPKTQSSYVFTALEGLPENRFNVNSSFVDSDGILYFGTIDGFTSFDPTLLLPSEIVPKPALTKLICTGENQERVVYDVDKTLFKLNHTENNVTFEFSSFTYTAPDALRCRYCLEPLDAMWHTQQGCAPITYLGLSPGVYTLKMQTMDYNGEWVDNEVRYKIEVLPPFYASWWAKLLYGCIVITGVFYVFMRGYSRIKAKQQARIQEVKEATEKEIYHTKINFFTTIVHEICTPLTLIKAPLEKELEKNCSENLLLVEKNVDRLENLCAQLLTFRKMESEKLQLNYVRTDLVDLLKSILYSFSAQIQQTGLRFEHNFDNLSLEAPVDREAFTKIVSNLINNALKYAKCFIVMELGVSGENFYLSVRNDGEKIETVDRGRVFNMFYRTGSAKEKPGVGIGLAFCRSLAEMQNGSLDLLDDDCTHFRLVLPMTQELVFSIEAGSCDFGLSDVSEELLFDSNDKIVLVVEDEPELRDFLKNTLSERYKVMVAANGVQAMDIIAKNQVTLVVTDVMMPKMDGCELCRAIKGNVEFCGIPVVMLTAKANVEARLDGYLAGAEEYIEKPFSMKYLMTRIAAIIAKNEKEAEAHFKSMPTIDIDYLASKSDKALLDKFRKLVDANLTNDNLNIAFLCEQLGVSQTTFFRKMKSVMDISPNDYIRMARLEKAASVLMEIDDVRISEVAYRSGFSSPSYFTRCFIQYYGVSPKVFVRMKKV